jgi:hypothetical protein
MLGQTLRDREVDPATAARDDSGFPVHYSLPEYFRHRRSVGILVESQTYRARERAESG